VKAELSVFRVFACWALFLVFCLLGYAQQLTTSDLSHAIESAIREGNLRDAISLARTGLQQSPRDEKLWTLEGIAFSRLGRTKEALNAYNTALEISRDYLPALEGAAELEYDSGNNRAAVLLNRVVRLHPENPTAHAMLGVLAYKRHDCASAAAHFQASGNAISSQPVALTEYGSCLMNLQKTKEALPIFERLLDLQPNDMHARYNVAVVQLSGHDARSAISTLQPLLQAPQVDPDVLDLASAAYEEAGDTPTAVKLLRQAIVQKPKVVRYYVDFAMLTFIHQSFQVGVDMVNVGLKENANAAPLYVARGILYIQLGRYDNGKADFELANKLDPQQTSGTVAEGVAQLQQSDLIQALSTVRSELRKHPQDAFLYYLEAEILMEQGVVPGTPEFKEAVEAANESVRLRPDFALSRDLLSKVYLKSGEFEKSIAESRQTLKSNPSDREALYHLIQGLQKSKDTDNEVPQLVKRLASMPESDEESTRYKLYETSDNTSLK
jgi:tetratricopeptide (TPR) repeat protein